MLVIRRSNCINAAYGIVFSVSDRPGCAPDGHLQRILRIPDAVLTQFDLLMMSTDLLETCRGL